MSVDPAASLARSSLKGAEQDRAKNGLRLERFEVVSVQTGPPAKAKVRRAGNPEPDGHPFELFYPVLVGVARPGAWVWGLEVQGGVLLVGDAAGFAVTTADPASPQQGEAWVRGDLGQLRVRVGATTMQVALTAVA